MPKQRERQKLGYWINLAGDVVEKWGCELVGVTRTGGNHLKITVRHKVTGETRFITAGVTPSDGRADKNARCHLRQACQQLQPGP